jgi:hypothetical protein
MNLFYKRRVLNVMFAINLFVNYQFQLSGRNKNPGIADSLRHLYQAERQGASPVVF